MRTKTPLLFILALGAPLQGAQHWELNLGGSTMDYRYADQTTLFGDLSYFIDPLAGSSPEPLRETTFVERPRTLHFGIMDMEFETSAPEGGFTSEEKVFRIDYTHRSSSSPHVFHLGYAYSDLQAHSRNIGVPFDEDDFRDTYEVGYAYYIHPRWTLGLNGSWQQEERGLQRDTLEVSVATRFLQPIGSHMWLSLVGEVSRAETDFDGDIEDLSYHSTDYSAGAMFYFSRHTSVGASWSYVDGSDIHNVAIEAEHFFTEQLAVGASVNRSLVDVAEDVTSYAGWIRLRF